MNTPIKLTDIPEAALSLIEASDKGGTAIFAQRDNHSIGRVKTAHKMRDMYRLYLERDDGSGEYRYSKKQAANIYLTIF